MIQAKINIVTCYFVNRIVYEGEELEDIMNSYKLLRSNERLKEVFRKSVEKYMEENKAYLDRERRKLLLSR